MCLVHRRRINTEGKAKVIAWRTELIQFLAALAVLHQADLKKRMNRITATWWKGCFEKLADHSVHTIPNHHPTKKDVLPKTFVQIILGAKWLVRYSSSPPTQQRRPLPSLLYLFFFYGLVATGVFCYTAYISTLEMIR